jgi:hypothetical protein
MGAVIYGSESNDPRTLGGETPPHGVTWRLLVSND